MQGLYAENYKTFQRETKMEIYPMFLDKTCGGLKMIIKSGKKWWWKEA